MNHFKKIIIASVIALSVPFSASGTPYFSFTGSSGSRYDNDESGVPYKNNRKYWSSTTANVLQYIGWGRAPRRGFEITDDLFWNYPGFRTHQGQRMMMEGSRRWSIGEVQNSSHDFQPAPEPGTLLLMGLGMFGLAYSIRSRWQQPS